MEKMPCYWKTGISDVETAVKNLKKADEIKTRFSAGGRPIQMIFFGKKNNLNRTANLSSALGARDKSCYADKSGEDYRPTILLVGCIHGGEFEGTAALLNLLSIIETGVESMPMIEVDNTDRNRTSPFAFTGNRFEFRMPGSSQSVSGVNVVLNTIVSESLSQFADILEKADDIETAAMDLVIDTFKKHKRIMFDGNGYSDDWVKEAEERGLPNLKTTADAIPHFATEKSVNLFAKHGVFTKRETVTRAEILLEDYVKVNHIEMLTMLEMAKQEILPACLEYTNFVVDGISKKASIGISVPNEKASAIKLSNLTEKLIASIDNLETISNNIPSDIPTASVFYKDSVIPAMNQLREVADELELIVAKDFWPFPTYSDLLYRV